jgi:GNAT superfamily N-acetyltransferase
VQTFGAYEIDTDPARVDRDAVWQFLSTEAYWGRWRARGDLEVQLDGAWRVIGAYHEGALVGFARVLSDGVATAYLADVFVLAEHRGRGLAQQLLHELIDNGPGAVFRWMLHTADAHGLYDKLGFGPATDRYLERPSPRPNAG